MKTLSKVLLLLYCVSCIVGCESIIGEYGDQSQQLDIIGTGSISPGNPKYIISNEESIFNGLEISVISSYTGPTFAFEISSGTIPDKTFNPHFTPLNEMLAISNGDRFSESTFFVKIPISTSEDEIPLVFAINNESNQLIPMPIVSSDNTSITFAAKQFSQAYFTNDLKSGPGIQIVDVTRFIIGTYPLSVLEEVMQTGSIKVGFKPGVDDWEFENLGTFMEPAGNCAGHCLSSLFYYDYKVWANQVGLNGLYDSDSKIWQDNSLGLRLVSEVQKDCMVIATNSHWDDFVLNSPGSTVEDYYNQYHQDALQTIALQLLITDLPLYAEISEKNSVSNLHAVLITGIDLLGHRIFVADPNFPGDQNRTVIIKDDGYIDYLSGKSSDSETVTYERLLCLGYSSISNWKIVADYWRNLLDGSIGDNSFPTCSYSVTFDPGSSPATTTALGVNDKNWIGSLSVSRKDTIIRIDCQVNKQDGGFMDSYLWIRKGDEWIAYSKLDESFVDLDLEGLQLYNSTIGIFVSTEMIEDGKRTGSEWIDFKWMKISEMTLEPAKASGKVNEELTWEVTLGDAPQNVRFEWDFGDGTGIEEILNSNVASHIFSELGEYYLMVKAHNNDNNELIGVTTGITIIENAIDDAVVDMYMTDATWRLTDDDGSRLVDDYMDIHPVFDSYLSENTFVDGEYKCVWNDVQSELGIINGEMIITLFGEPQKINIHIEQHITKDGVIKEYQVDYNAGIPLDYIEQTPTLDVESHVFNIIGDDLSGVQLKYKESYQNYASIYEFVSGKCEWFVVSLFYYLETK